MTNPTHPESSAPVPGPDESATKTRPTMVPMPKVGDMVMQFKLDSLLGEGGMGLVFKATDTTLDREVAIKFFNQNLLNDKPRAIIEELKRRFIREARLSAKINHPNLAQIYQAGLDASTPYFVMEFLEGETLEDLLEREPVQAMTRICTFAAQICSALKYAWETNQIIHRDLKPANIMIMPGDHVKLLDLGIAKVAENPELRGAGIMKSSGITRPGIGVGSPLYMAPEQHIGEPDVDQRGDIFAFGAILYRMLTLRLPYDGESEYLLYTSKMEGVKRDIEKWAPDAPKGLVTMVYRMLDSNREHRLGSHDEILAILQDCVRSLPAGVLAGSGTTSDAATSDERSNYGTARMSRRKTPPTLADVRNRDGEAQAAAAASPAASPKATPFPAGTKSVSFIKRSAPLTTPAPVATSTAPKAATPPPVVPPAPPATPDTPVEAAAKAAAPNLPPSILRTLAGAVRSATMSGKSEGRSTPPPVSVAAAPVPAPAQDAAPATSPPLVALPAPPSPEPAKARVPVASVAPARKYAATVQIKPRKVTDADMGDLNTSSTSPDAAAGSGIPKASPSDSPILKRLVRAQELKNAAAGVPEPPSNTTAEPIDGPRTIPRKPGTVSTARVQKSTEKALLTESMRLRLKEPDLSVTSDVIAQTRPPVKSEAQKAREGQSLKASTAGSTTISGMSKSQPGMPRAQLGASQANMAQPTRTQDLPRLKSLGKRPVPLPDGSPANPVVAPQPPPPPKDPETVEYDIVVEEKEVFLPQMRELLEFIQPGMVLGDYQTIDLVGFGGMGAVYSGRHVTSGNPVALKFLIADDRDDFNFRLHQIKNEAKIISRLDHASIVKLHDMQQINGMTFIVMDLYLGPHGRPVNLMDYAKSFGDANGLIAEDDLKSICASLLRAIGYAHSMGVVHCDLKPENVLFDCVSTHADGKWDAYLMLTDFGLAKIVGEDLVLSSATASVDSFTGDVAIPDDAGALIGTFEYMSPEQRRGEAANAASDLFTVGIMMLRLLTGAKELGLRSRPSKLRPGIHRNWDKIILKALREHPDERFPNAEAMLEALLELPC